MMQSSAEDGPRTPKRAGQATWRELFRRLRWDLLDPLERAHYGYWFIKEVPGIFGNMLRARYLARRMARAGKNLSVLGGCRFRSLELLEVGDNVSIGYDCFLQAKGGLTVGDNVLIGPGTRIWSVNHDYSDPGAAVADQGQTEKPVIIGNDVFIGAGVFISPGVTLPDSSVVCAGAIVGVKAYRPNSILAGNPARVIGFRGGVQEPAVPAPQEQAV
jgi:acetyltransferase-like isoleucine patch superfamily enzyme